MTALVCKLIGHRLRWTRYDHIHVCQCRSCRTVLAIAPIPQAGLDAIQNTAGTIEDPDNPGCYW